MTFVSVLGAVSSGCTRRTRTSVVSFQVCACTLSTRVCVTLVDDCVAVSTCVAGVTSTGVTVFTIYTNSVHTWVAFAFIDIGLARHSCETITTCAAEAVQLVFACSTILTWIRVTFVKVNIAVNPRPSWYTVTSIAVHVVMACGIVLARVRDAVIDIDIAYRPSESR